MKQLSLNLKTKSSGVIADTEGLNSEPHVFSVSELNGSLKSAIEEQYGLVWLQGEISNFKAHTSGHFYFSLKDKNSQISAVMFKGFNRLLKFSPTDGMEVLVRGKVTVYEPRGSYQVFCEFMEPLGAGALQIAYEQLKAKLQNEGLFDLDKKRPLPKFPQKIAIITAPT
ncbi:MAG: exodeoxyribonuclease VII large subunit, partial [Bdellovibrionales bacterium]|nr:exodeoxyribonuclease VII large subunit [Bdellovibrionales bacterium]